MTADSATGLAELDEVYWRLMELRPKFPGAPLIRIRPDWREETTPSGPAADLFRRHLAEVQTVLDVGAGDRLWEQVIGALSPSSHYRTVDIDKLHQHDFSDFLGVTETFDAILMLELLEHLMLEQGLRFFEHAVSLLNRGGVLVISTPNPRHAHQVWSADITHVRPWPAHDLWSLCQISGLEQIEIYRQILVTRRRRLALPIQLAMSRLLGLDPAYGLLLFAHKAPQ